MVLVLLQEDMRLFFVFNHLLEQMNYLFWESVKDTHYTWYYFFRKKCILFIEQIYSILKICLIYDVFLGKGLLLIKIIMFLFVHIKG